MPPSISEWCCWEAEAYSEPCQASKIELFTNIVNSRKPLTILTKNFILDIWHCHEYASEKVGDFSEFQVADMVWSRNLFKKVPWKVITINDLFNVIVWLKYTLQSRNRFLMKLANIKSYFITQFLLTRGFIWVNFSDR